MRISDWSSDVCSSDLIFTYQITDGDGDTSTATLTIRIADAPTVITFVPGEGDDGTIVYEDDLPGRDGETPGSAFGRSEEHTSELQSLMRISSAVYCLQNKKITHSYNQYNGA